MGKKSFSHAEGGGGGLTSFEVDLTRELEFVTILLGGGGTKSFHLLKEGVAKGFTLSWGGGGGQKVLDPRFSHFVAYPPPPTPPVINGRPALIKN